MRIFEEHHAEATHDHVTLALREGVDLDVGLTELGLAHLGGRAARSRARVSIRN